MRRLQRKGFILVATLWMLAACTIAMTLFAAWVSRATDRALALNEDTRAAIDMFTTRETLLYLASTRGLTHRGINLPAGPTDNGSPAAPDAHHEILLDSTPYKGLQRARFNLQDEAGLINLNKTSSGGEAIENLLSQRGISNSGERYRLLSALRDYTEHGLERTFLAPSLQDYRKAGRPEPLYRPLISNHESWRALGWEKHPQLWEGNYLANFTTVLHYGGLNVNTAPREVLQAVARLNESEAQAAIDARRERGFATAREAEVRGGLPMSANLLSLAIVPSRHLRLTLWHSEANRGVRYHITVTPERHGAGPWLVDHVYPVSGVQIADGADPAEVASPLLTSPDSGTAN